MQWMKPIDLSTEYFATKNFLKDHHLTPSVCVPSLAGRFSKLKCKKKKSQNTEDILGE